MPTFTALTTLPGRSAANSLGAAMENLTPEPTGIGVFEVEDGSGLFEVGGYFTQAPDESSLAVLTAAFGAANFVVSELPETDWVAHVRRELSPVRAGRFFVYGSHDADNVPDDVIPLLIEAAMAFGTGHHGTTLGCLEALDRLVSDGFHPTRVADIGCGTAVLAMAAARVWGGPGDADKDGARDGTSDRTKDGAKNPDCVIIASDIDEVAVDVAVANLAANGMQGQVECVEAAGFDHEALRRVAPFDLIFANILKGPLIALAPDMAEYLHPRGFAILSGLLNEQADQVVEVYAQSGINLVQSTRIGDWTTLLLGKLS